MQDVTWQRIRVLVFVGVLFLTVACNKVFEPDLEPRYEVLPAILWDEDRYQSSVGGAIQVPDSAAVGDSIMVTVWTVSGGCNGRGPDVVDRLSATLTMVTPHDRYYRGGGDFACTADIRPLKHEIVLMFEGPGQAGIVIRTRVRGTQGQDSLVTDIRNVWIY